MIHSNDKIAKDIEVCYKDSMNPIRMVNYADFDNGVMLRYSYDEDGKISSDGLGIILNLYRAKIIPVYKGE